MKILGGYYSMIKDILVGPLNASFFARKVMRIRRFYTIGFFMMGQI